MQIFLVCIYVYVHCMYVFIFLICTYISTYVCVKCYAVYYRCENLVELIAYLLYNEHLLFPENVSSLCKVYASDIGNLRGVLREKSLRSKSI